MQTCYHKLSRDILVALIVDGSTIDRCGAICEIVRRKLNQGMVVGSTVENTISSYENDNSVFWNSFSVGDFATAAVHLLRGEPYKGNRTEIKELIAAKMDFS